MQPHYELAEVQPEDGNEKYNDDGVGVLDPAESEESIEQELQMDTILAHYFGDVRQFALLKKAEERALCYRIEALQKKERRVLSMAPTALPILINLWTRVQRGKLSLQYILRSPEQTGPDMLQQFGSAVAELQTIAADLQMLADQARGASKTTAKRRKHRQTHIGLRRVWCKTWEALGLNSRVYDAIRQTLVEGEITELDDPVLFRLRCVWQTTQRRLASLRNRMVCANLRLVVHVANRYKDRGVLFLDLIQEGNIGLMRALDRFEPRRNLKFSTYAHWWVRQAISRTIVEQSKIIRVPQHMVEAQNKVRAATSRLLNEGCLYPTVHQLATALGWAPEKVEEVQKAGLPISHLDEVRSFEKEGSGALADVVEDDDAPNTVELVMANQLHQCMETCLSSLTEREEFILRMRYGLDDEQPHTLQEIADILKLSRERVRQLERQALHKLRGLRGAGLREIQSEA